MTNLFVTNTIGFAVAVFLGMLAAMVVGRRLGKRRLASNPEGAQAGLAAVEGALFGLLGLLVAFTFNGAATRLDTRRDQIVAEANAIGTAWLRLEMIPAPAREEIKDLFRRYLDSRILIYKLLPDLRAAKEETVRANALQIEIWTKATVFCRTDEGRSLTMLLLPALNEMFDITTVRTAMASRHPPPVIFALLFILSLSSSFFIGYGMAATPRPGWIHVVGFAAILAFSVYVIVDLEHPRLGFIREDAQDQLLFDLRESMK